MKKGWKRLLATVLAVVMVATSSNAWSMQVVAEGTEPTVSGNETNEPAQEVTEPTPENTNPTPDTNVEPVVEEEPEDTTPTDVVVTITGNSATFTYDGKEHSVSGYTVSSSDSSYTEADFSFDGNALVSATEAGTYNMGLSADAFTNNNEKYNAQFEVTDGVLTIEKAVEPVEDENTDGEKTEGESFEEPIVEEQAPVMMKSARSTSVKTPLTITTGSAEKEYDSTELTSTEVTAEGLAEGHTLEATTSGSITDAGTTANTLESWKIVDTDGNDVSDQYDVAINEGTLTVTPRTGVIVAVEGNYMHTDYSGKPITVSGYKICYKNDSLYTIDDFEYVGEASITETEIGAYDMNLDASKFVNINSNFKNVSFAVGCDGFLTIQESLSMGGYSGWFAITALTATKMYDGEPLTAGAIAICEECNPTAYFKYEMTADSTITNVGTQTNQLAEWYFTGGEHKSIKSSTYTKSVGIGTLTVTPRTGVTVTIIPKSETIEYDGNSHTFDLSNYEVSVSDAGGLDDLYTADDFEFVGDPAKFTITATDVGTYNLSDYISAADFENKNTNFADVTFVVADGGLTIDGEIPLIITTGTATKEYDGEPLTANATAEGLVEGHTFSATTTSITDAGTVANEVLSWNIVDAQGNNVNDWYEATINEGTLTITPIEEMIYVVIKANNLGTFIYTGEEQFVTAEQAWSFFNVSNPLYTKNDYEYRGEEIVARGTEKGTYPFDLDKSAWVNINPNFKNVTFAVGTGQMQIGSDVPAHSGGSDSEYYALILADGTKMYDGEPLVVHEYHDVGLKQEGYTASITWDEASTITDVGSVENKAANIVYRRGGTTSSWIKSYVEVFNGRLTVTPRTGVTVTITPNSETVYADGTEKSVDFSNYTVSISDAGGLNDLYTADDFEFIGDPEKLTITATEAGTYNLSDYISAADFENTNTNFEDVNFVIADGGLTIKEKEKVTVTIKGHTLTTPYDGTEKTVSGYDVSINNANYTEDDFSFSGTAEVKMTNVKSSSAGSKEYMGLDVSQFTNNNPDYDVTFSVTDGYLMITSITEEVVVHVKGRTETYIYDGNEHNVGGYDVTIEGGDGLFTEDDIIFSGNDAVKGTDAGTYEMELSPDDFTSNNPNFENVEFVIDETGGQLVIEPLSGVKVTITENSDEVVYNGEEHSVTGYTVETSSALYTENCFSFSGTAKAVGTDVGSYDMEVSASDFANTSKNFTDVTFEVVDGQLEITPITEEVVVTITENSGAYTYDGEEKSVTGYSVKTISNSLYTENDFTYSGEAIAKGTRAGKYAMNVNASKFTNNNANFANVKFVVEDGFLTITASDEEVVVYITGNTVSPQYNGEEQSVSGYTVSISNSLYKESDFTFSGNAVVTGTNVGEYKMGLKASDFTNNNPDFSKVTFVVSDGVLNITKNMTPITVTVTGNGDTFEYDGEEKTVSGYDVEIEGGDGLFTENDVIYTGDEEPSATRTDIGETSMGIDPDDFDISDNFGAVTIVVVPGSDVLTITAIDGVVVTITENSDTVEYNGKEQKVEGYSVTSFSNNLYTVDDFEFSGSAIATGKNAGFYDMNLTAANFVNKNNNFTNVTFEIVDGGLTIEKYKGKVTVTIEGGGKETEYTGEEQEAGGYDITDIVVEGDDDVIVTEDDIKYVGDDEPTAKGKDVGTYPIIDEDDFDSDNFEDIEIVIKDGTGDLVITPMTGVVVTVTGTSGTFAYDGTEKRVEGYEISVEGKGEGLYTKDMITFDGEAVVKGTEPGEYFMDIVASQFGNGNANFEDVTFVIDTEGGKLTITDERFTLTIHYVDGNGKKLADDHVAKHFVGDSFKVVSPSINGYTANYASISSDENGMPAQDVELTVTYTANPVNTPDDNDGDDDDDDIEEESTEEESTEELPIQEPVTPPSRPSDDDDDDDDDDEESWTPAPRNDPPTQSPVEQPKTAAQEPNDPIVQVEEATDMEVSVDENGLLTLTPIGDGETPLSNWMWGDEGMEHACNIANFLMMLAALVIYMFYTKRMKTLQARVFELNEKLGTNQAQE